MNEYPFDLELKVPDVQAIGNADALAGFFERLGYNTAARTPQTAGNLQLPEALSRSIRRIELMADNDRLLQVYLFELKSVTLGDMRGLARAFKDFAGNFLLVLTANYEDLDFVLLDRGVAPAATQLSSPQPGIVPRRITIERRKPTPVDLRVLRRLTWTESDALGQFDKLRYAYDLAYWTEVYFNNRGLFSDYYLLERLRPKGGEPEFPEWLEDPKPAYLKLRAIYAQASARFAGKTAAELCESLYEPLLAELGFKTERETKSSPLYLRLADPAVPDQVLGLCLPWPWGRELDRKDEQRDSQAPESTPTFIVVELLAAEKAPWVILTNGKLWRLYSQRAHSRATNYYEIDLDEILGRQGFEQDIQDAFRFFWLLFRMRAFRPEDRDWQGAKTSLSLLDRLLLGSEDYAKQLGEKLKERVFEDVFPHLAEGFIAHIRRREPDVDFNEERLSAIYQATLTLLYRLLFLLYAEARDLLPVHSSRAYFQASLGRIKNDVAQEAGTLPDEAADKVRKHYADDSYELWKRLRNLFRTIDKGSEELNVPRYNGGLFQAEREAGDDSPEAQAARFLEREKIADRYLARAIDLLARGIDPKHHDLAFVDYKSLGVRQLGSIYEGLLEFQLRIAGQKLAITKEKGREVYAPFRDLGEREKERAERHGNFIRKGRAYLENDRRERKATGSYYTPDHIVDYIVEHAVGPVLDEKLEAMRPRLREAQRERREFDKRQQEFLKRHMRPEPAEKADLIGRDLVDELFNIKVLDPAMGSGHFLVEAVDFITDRILAFLTAFPWNPVQVHLRKMCETISKQMEEQNVEVDIKRLTDVNLLKRHVLKRCIYGVDLNPMAVELAKVSLWLDCFTLGAPLSFLDHHLRCGNSLIGAMVADVDKIRQEKGQLSLTATSDWTGLTQAVQLMVDVGGMPDITAQQVSESRNEYKQALTKLESFKRVLHLHTARWFVEIEKAGKGKKREADLFDEMLRSGDLFDWANERIPTPLGGARDAARVKPIIHQALAAAKGKLFFHWELEFPEVFYGRRPGTQNAVERLDAAGFDAVVGNPPYDELSEHALGRSLDELSFFEDNPCYSWVGKGRLNWYHFFVARALELTASHGGHGYIVPMSLLGDQFTRPTRTVLLQSGRFTRIEAFPQKDDPRRRVFFDAKLPTCLYTVRRGSDRFLVRVHPANEIDISSPHYECAPEALSRVDSVNLSIPLVSERGWSLLSRFAQDEHLGTLRECGATPTSGEIVFNQQFRKYLSSSPTDTLLLRGSHVQRWEIVEEAKQGEPLYLDKASYLADAREDSKAFDHRNPRVVYQECAAIDNWRRVIAAYLPAGFFCGHKICYFTDYRCSPTALLAVFNSRLIDWIVTAISTNNSLPAYLVGALPFPKFGPIADPDGRELLRLYEAGIASGNSSSEIFEAMHGLIADRSRCFPAMHCTLAHLGSRMIDWHRQQRAGINRFLGALAGILAPPGERLSEPPGRGQLKNFLGDYQRNAPQKEFEWVWAVLVKSGVGKLRSIDGSIKNQVQSTHGCYVNELLPTKRKLATTDRLIDRLVYHAYGLHEADMDAVDRERIIPEGTEDTG